MRLKREREEAAAVAEAARHAQYDVQEAEERAQVKVELAQRKEQEAADGVETLESVNLTGEWPAAAPFVPTDELKPCPKCRRACNIRRERQQNPLHCGNGHCRASDCLAEFCWKCGVVFDTARATRRAGGPLRALGGHACEERKWW